MRRTVFVGIVIAVGHAAAWSFSPPPPPEDETAGFLKMRAISLGADTLPKRAAVGGAAGFVGGYALKASQNFVLNAGLCGGGALAAACVAGWLSPEELVEKAEGLVEKADSYMEVGLKMLLGESGPDAKKAAASRVSKISLSKMYKTAPGLIGGAALGAALGFRIG